MRPIFLRHPSIGNWEYRAFSTLTLSGLGLRLTELALALVFPPSNEGIHFGIYSIFHMWEKMSPIYSFLGFLICSACLIRLRVPSLSIYFISSALLTFFFDWWLVDTRLVITRASDINPNYEFGTFDFALLNGTAYDFATLILINFLFVWQASILFRSSRSDKSMECKLP
jgi:hypothetical protein